MDYIKHPINGGAVRIDNKEIMHMKKIISLSIMALVLVLGVNTLYAANATTKGFSTDLLVQTNVTSTQSFTNIVASGAQTNYVIITTNVTSVITTNSTVLGVKDDMTESITIWNNSTTANTQWVGYVNPIKNRQGWPITNGSSITFPIVAGKKAPWAVYGIGDSAAQSGGVIHVEQQIP